MIYRVAVEPRAKRDLKAAPQHIRERVAELLTQLSLDPRPHGCLKLADSHRGGYRMRIGTYRLLYTVDDATRAVGVYKIRPRSDAYRDE